MMTKIYEGGEAMDSTQFRFEYPLCLPAPKCVRRLLPYLILAGMFICGCITFFFVPIGSSAQETAPGDFSSTVSDACFRIDDGVLSFDKRYYNGERILVIPAFVDGQAVTAIRNECFRDIAGFTTVLLPNSITEIGNYAFADCADLRGVLLPEGVVTVGQGAFENCEKLESVYIPLSVSDIGENAFEGCPRLIYIFYNGFYSTWIKMYDQFITPYTWIMCLDGDHLHAAFGQ